MTGGVKKKRVKSSPFRQRGLSLIELMVSIAIGLLIMAGVVQMFGTSSRNAMTSVGMSRIQENIRYTFARLAEDIGQTGNLGCVSATTDAMVTSKGHAGFLVNTLGLAASSGEAYDFASIISGDDNANGSTSPAGDVVSATDTFRLRYMNHGTRLEVTEHDVVANAFKVDNGHASYASLEQYQVVGVTNCQQGLVFMVTNDPQSSAGVIEYKSSIISNGINSGQFNVATVLDQTVKYAPFAINDGTSIASSVTYLYAGTTGSYQYFIGHAQNAKGLCDPISAPQNCALIRRENGNNRELVQGVHDMQIEYGWTDKAGKLLFANASTISDWSAIDRVRVQMSFNSIENAAAFGNNVNKPLTKIVSRTFNLPNQL